MQKKCGYADKFRNFVLVNTTITALIVLLINHDGGCYSWKLEAESSKDSWTIGSKQLHCSWVKGTPLPWERGRG